MLENLLSGQEEFQKEIGVELPKEVQSWPQAVVQAVLDAVPFVANFKNIEPVFNKVDKEKGYAIGAVIVATEKAKISFPVVVQNFVLSPVDVFIDANGNFRPATQERVQTALFNPEVMAETVDPKKEVALGAGYSSIMRDTYPPSGGGYTMGREAIAGATILNAILHTVTSTDKEKLASCMMKNPEIAVMLKRAGLSKWIDAVMSAPETKEKRAGVDMPAGYYDIFQVLPTSSVNQVRVKIASSIYGEPVEKIMSVQMLEKLAEEMAAEGQPGMQQAAQQPGQVVTPDQMMGDPNSPDNFIDVEATMAMQPADKPGVYKVMSVMGDKLSGYVFPNVFTFDLQPAGVKVFCGMGQAAIQEEIIGELVDGTSRPQLSVMSPGKTYVLAYFGTKPGQALALIPLQIANMMKVGSDLCIIAQDIMQGSAVMLVPTKGIETVVAATPEMLGEKMIAAQGIQGAYLIPDDIMAVEFTATTQLITSPQEADQIMQMGGPKALAAQQQAQAQAEQQQQAQAQAPQGQAPAPAPQGQAPAQPQPQGQPKQASVIDGRVIYDPMYKKFDIQCPMITKIAGLRTECLDEYELAFSLTVGGVTPGEAAGIAKIAAEKGQCNLYDLTPPISYKEKVAVAQTMLEDLRGKLNFGVDPIFLKVATVVQYDEDVDSVLSLNFLKPENLVMFTKALPHLIKTESTLAALLMAARIGKRELSQDDIKECMVKLTTIIDTIKQVM